MYCRHLSLANFRNYTRLELGLPPHLTVLWGNNGQGKSNLLEAVYLLATTRSYRTSAERELVNWHVDVSPVFARVAAEVVRHQTTSKLEILLAEPPRSGPTPAPAVPDEPSPTGPGQAPVVSIRRRVRINGHHRPPAELLGHLNAVLFSPEDVELIAGPAEVRRRYLTITLCQVDHRYLRAARRYDRVLQQRNALLRELRERAARRDQLDYWDEQIVELGGEMVVARLRALATMNRHLQAISPRLSSEPEPVRAVYRSSVPLGDAEAILAERAAGREAADVVTLVRQRFQAHLTRLRDRERAQGVTLAGPHRDDVAFLAGPVDLRIYGSRGQQRTAALGVKLAEVRLMEEYTADHPVLLLDDVLSELDPRRRGFLQAVVAEQQQVLLTATDLDPFTSDFLKGATVFRVSAGTVTESVPGTMGAGGHVIP